VWAVTSILMFIAKAARLPWRGNFLGTKSDPSAKWTTDTLLCSANSSISGNTTIPPIITPLPGGIIIPGPRGGVTLSAGVGDWVSVTNITTTITRTISPPCYRSRASRLDAPPCLSRLSGMAGGGGNGLPQWSQSRPCNHIYITQKPQPCLSRLNGMGEELHCSTHLRRERSPEIPNSN